MAVTQNFTISFSYHTVRIRTFGPDNTTEDISLFGFNPMFKMCPITPHSQLVSQLLENVDILNDASMVFSITFSIGTCYGGKILKI